MHKERENGNNIAESRDHEGIRETKVLPMFGRGG
jgi:hypothetical protein